MQANGANGQESGPALTSGFLDIVDHSAANKTFFRLKVTRTFLVIPKHGPQNVHFGSMIMAMLLTEGQIDWRTDGQMDRHTDGKIFIKRCSVM